MAVNKSIVESVDLDAGGSLSIYITTSNRVALTTTVNDSEFVTWVTEEDAQKFSEAITKAIEEFHHG